MTTYSSICNSIENKSLKQAYGIVLPIAQAIVSKHKTRLEWSLEEKMISKLLDAISLIRNCEMPKGMKRKTTKEVIIWNDTLIKQGAKL